MQIINFKARNGEVRGYIQEDYPTLVAHKLRPALIICPGGAYCWCSPREEDPVAFPFMSLGYQVFILEYSCGEGAADYRPLRELAETVCRLRENSSTWHIDPDKIAVMGFSAGGHLVASLGALWNDSELALPRGCRPDAVVLCYPVISAREYAHEESIEWVTGHDAGMRSKLHIPDRVGPDFPPCFLWHGGEDDAVPPENSLMLASALRRQGVPVELHIFSSGGHGISTCTREVETPDEACKPWLMLCENFLNRQFNYEP